MMGKYDGYWSPFLTSARSKAKRARAAQTSRQSVESQERIAEDRAAGRLDVVDDAFEEAADLWNWPKRPGTVDR